MKNKNLEFKKYMHQDEFISFTKKIVNYLSSPEGLKKFLNALFYAAVGIVVVIMLVTRSSNIDSQVQKSFANAQSQYFGGEYDITIKNLEKLLKDYPKTKYTGEIMYYLGNCYYRTGKYDDAIKNYESAKKKYIQPILSPVVYSSLSYAYEEKKEYDKATANYDEILKKFPDYYGNDRILFDMARCLRLSGKTEQAKEKYKEIVNKFPNSPLLPAVKENMER